MTNPIRSITQGLQDWLNQPTPRKQMLPAYFILTLGIIAGFARFEAIAEERAQDLRADTDRNAATICLARVETRDSLRGVLIGITELFDNTEEVAAVVKLIQDDYPPLDPTVCNWSHEVRD
jgi:hypothetical protein